jgi:mercuric reductase
VPEVADALRAVFADDGITVVEDRAVACEAGGGRVAVLTGGGRRTTGRRLLVATGRTPMTAELNLDAAAVKTDDRGFVQVDEEQRTANPRIFAAGDVTGAPQYVYVAAAAGRVAAANATSDGCCAQPATVDYTGMPAVVFTRPQLASAGLTEAKALTGGHRCDCRVLALADVPRALANRDSRGVIKLVADADPGRYWACTPPPRELGRSCSPPPTRSRRG